MPYDLVIFISCGNFLVFLEVFYLLKGIQIRNPKDVYFPHILTFVWVSILLSKGKSANIPIELEKIKKKYIKNAFKSILRRIRIMLKMKILKNLA